MSPENVEVVRSLFDAFDRGDTEAVFALIHPDVEWEQPAGIPGGKRTVYGHEGVRAGWAAWLAEWEWYGADHRGLIEADNRVVAWGIQRGRGRTSGVEVEKPYASVFTVRDGKIVRHEAFADKAEALAALRSGG